MTMTPLREIMAAAIAAERAERARAAADVAIVDTHKVVDVGNVDVVPGALGLTPPLAGGIRDAGPVVDTGNVVDDVGIVEVGPGAAPDVVTVADPLPNPFRWPAAIG